MDNTPTETPRAMSVAQFCQRFGVSKGMTFALLRQNKLQRVKAGRRTLIPVESAEAWWASLAKAS